MKPVRFKYFAPETVAEAVARLEEYGDEAKVLAGGQSLVPLMNLRLARPGVLVDICRIPRLDEIRRNGSLSIGATARQRAVRQSDEVAAAAPIITEVMRWVGHPATQSQGTFGGMAAHADPAAEIPAVLLALDAELVATGRDGERAIPAGEFFSTWFTTTLAPTEILTEVRIPASASQSRSAFLELARRHGDFAMVGAAAVVELDEAGTAESSRLTLCGVGDTPVRAHGSEEFLVGRQLDSATMQEAARMAAADLSPPSDVHASSEYRQEVAAVLVRRALEQIAADT
ncbi:MAG: xanthine dehydrogenase family protein subunit M [Actinomycetia bacterium]|nr:xanthine dehydrogenase family protein subunit M [Actinomycetes bacterium]